MNEPTEAGSENAPILFDPSPVEKLLLFAVVALTIAVIVLGVKLSNVDGGSGGCGPKHTHSMIYADLFNTWRVNPWTC